MEYLGVGQEGRPVVRLAWASTWATAQEAARVSAVLILVGFVNIPIIKFSVEWWNTLHQGATIKLFKKSTMDASMVLPLIALTFATKLWFTASLLARTRAAMFEQESGKDWARRVAEEGR